MRRLRLGAVTLVCEPGAEFCAGVSLVAHNASALRLEAFGEMES